MEKYLSWSHYTCDEIWKSQLRNGASRESKDYLSQWHPSLSILSFSCITTSSTFQVPFKNQTTPKPHGLYNQELWALALLMQEWWKWPRSNITAKELRSGFKYLFFPHDKFLKVFCYKPDFRFLKNETWWYLKSRHTMLLFHFHCFSCLIFKLCFMLPLSVFHIFRSLFHLVDLNDKNCFSSEVCWDINVKRMLCNIYPIKSWYF